jgi:hypothetical protein
LSCWHWQSDDHLAHKRRRRLLNFEQISIIDIYWAIIFLMSAIGGMPDSAIRKILPNLTGEPLFIEQIGRANNHWPI